MPTDTKTWNLKLTLPGEEPRTLTNLSQAEFCAVLQDLLYGPLPSELTATDEESPALAA